MAPILAQDQDGTPSSIKSKCVLWTPEMAFDGANGLGSTQDNNNASSLGGVPVAPDTNEDQIASANCISNKYSATRPSTLPQLQIILEWTTELRAVVHWRICGEQILKR
jgi:hypothetical protein